MKKYTITVTEKHLDESLRRYAEGGYMINIAQNCPVAVAVSEATGREASVGYYSFGFLSRTESDGDNQFNAVEPLLMCEITDAATSVRLREGSVSQIRAILPRTLEFVQS